MPVGYVNRENQFLGTAVSLVLEGHDLDKQNAAVLAPMPPDPGRAISIVALTGSLHECGGIVGRTDVHQGHRQKLFPRIAVAPHGGVIYFQEVQCLAVIDPHRIGIGREHNLAALFGVPQLLSCLGELCSKARLVPALANITLPERQERCPNDDKQDDS